MPLTKTPLSITFHPAYHRDISGPKPVGWPGTFDGGSASGEAAAQTELSTGTTTGGFEPVLQGDFFLFPYTYQGNKQLAAGGFALKQTSMTGPYKLRRFFGGVAGPVGLMAPWSMIGSEETVSNGVSGRSQIFSCQPTGFGGDENVGIELAWGGENDDPFTSTLNMTDEYASKVGTVYSDTSDPDLDLYATNAGGSWGSKVRYRMFTGESQESIYMGGCDGSHVGLYTGYISAPRAVPKWREELAVDRISSVDEHYGTENKRLTDSVTRWGTGGFDINKRGQFAIAWCARVDEGMCVCIWTGTINAAGDIYPATTMNGVAKVFVPYLNDYNGDVPSDAKFWEGTPGSSNTFLFYNPNSSEADGSAWPPRHPQVVVTETTPAYVYIQLAMKERPTAHLGKHVWTTNYNSIDDPGDNMSKGWEWDTKELYKGTWGIPCDHDPDGSDVMFICEGVPVVGTAGNPPSSFAESPFLNDFRALPNWVHWGVKNFAYKRCSDVDGSSYATYMCAGGYTAKQGAAIVPEALYCIMWAVPGSLGKSTTFDVVGNSPGVGACIRVCSYGDIT